MVLGGGAMDPAFRRADTDRDALVARMRAGGIWSMNGKAIMGHGEEGRLFHFGLGEHVHMAIANDTAFDHPIHMHGHHFRVLSRNGRKPPSPIWRDTVVLKSGDGLEIAFVADNPGKWMLHCHILEHQMAGMTGWFEIS
jgi:FtsP/CotA-like multicopper oxidase with cupredoxin domain